MKETVVETIILIRFPGGEECAAFYLIELVMREKRAIVLACCQMPTAAHILELQNILEILYS